MSSNAFRPLSRRALELFEEAATTLGALGAEQGEGRVIAKRRRRAPPSWQDRRSPE
jgi:hypothetical protein